MLTVLIAEADIIEKYRQLNTIFAPLITENIRFCEWNRNGQCIEEMVPDLYPTISRCDDWRAVIIDSGNETTVNPFDRTGYKQVKFDKNDIFAGITENRSRKFKCYEESASNPLTILTAALSEQSTYKNKIDDAEVYQALVSGDISFEEHIVKGLLEAVDVYEFQREIKGVLGEMLQRFADSEHYGELIDAIAGKNADAVRGIVPHERMLEFFSVLSKHDPIWSDPMYLECCLEDTKKAEIFDRINSQYPFNDKKPAEIYCLSQRTINYEEFKTDVSWRRKDEFRSSIFKDTNLYSENVKFMVFDIMSKKNKQYFYDMVRYMNFILIFCSNTVPTGVMNPCALYRVVFEYDESGLSEMCTEYIDKLANTKLHILELKAEIRAKEPQPVDSKVAQDVFESNITIPVSVDSRFNKNELYAKYSSIGMSGDCPVDEEGFWDGQYRTIKKKFSRFLREPRRSVQTAAEKDFHINNSIDDERALNLNIYQKEDVEFRLEEEENNMVDTHTVGILDADEYLGRIDKAHKELHQKIGERMTRKRTVIVGVICILAYLFGFLPLIFTNVNTVKSFSASLLFACVAIDIFLIVSVVVLLVFRHKLINRFKHFNFEMSGILKDIDHALELFSKYLSHACNVMRIFSVLNFLKRNESTDAKTLKIYDFHIYRIDSKIGEISDVFGGYLSKKDRKPTRENDIYDFDYTKSIVYDFEMPYEFDSTEIEFLQKGRTVRVPVSYVKSIILQREELYD